MSSSEDESDFSSSGLAKRKSRMMTIGITPTDTDPLSHFPRSPTPSASFSTAINPDTDKYPGGINPSHWSLTRYSTGQLLSDDESQLVSWYDIQEFELVELHGPSFPSTHVLYEYQVCHLWNPERHRERERLRGKLKKRFEVEINSSTTSKHSKDKDKNKDKEKDKDTRAAYHAQILKAMNLNSGAGANVGVVEYYGHRLSQTKFELRLSRIPRSIDLYVQPYWEGWVRTLRIVWRGDWNDVAFGSGVSVPVASGVVPGVSGGGGTGAPQGQGIQQVVMEPYRYGNYSSGTITGGFGMGVNVYAHAHSSLGEKDHHQRHWEGNRSSSSVLHHKLVRVEWRERWVKIQNGYLSVLKEREVCFFFLSLFLP